MEVLCFETLFADKSPSLENLMKEIQSVVLEEIYFEYQKAHIE